MSSDLIKIKEKYGEKMMHLCRGLFPTILEKEGLLFHLLSSHFAYSRYLCEDIVNNSLESSFVNYIYDLLEPPKELPVVLKTAKELLDEAGYILYECKSEEDIQSFRKYYESRENLCTFRGGRLNKCYVFFAIKKNIDKIKRENFINPLRQDLYGTSIISIQFRRGNINRLSIKNRYNHTVNNPDATYSNNLENIIPGLTRSFERDYNLNICQNITGGFEIPGYVCANDGKYYKYNYEINNIYYCDNNIIIDNYEVIDKYQEKEKYIIMDYFIIDLVNKKISLYDNNINDSFINSIGNIKKIDINKCSGTKNKRLRIVFDDDTYMFIEIDKHNRMISYSNDNIIDIPDNFLKDNIYLKKMDIPNVSKIGNNFLYENKYMEEINALKLLEIGNGFLYKNDMIKSLFLPNLIKVGDSFLHDNKVLNMISLSNLMQVGNEFLKNNKGLKEIDLSNLVYVGNDFISCNKILENINICNLVKVGNNFLAGNKLISKLYLPKLIEVGHNFLYCNEIITEISANNLEKVGNNFMRANRNLIIAYLSKLRIIGDNFLYKNNSIKVLELYELLQVGHNFMKENNSLLILIASKLKIVGINFLCKNNVIEYTDLSSLVDYGRYIFDSNIDVKRRVLGLS